MANFINYKNVHSLCPEKKVQFSDLILTFRDMSHYDVTWEPAILIRYYVLEETFQQAM